MKTILKRIGLATLVLIVVTAGDVWGQGPFSVQIQQAISQLINGVTPFTDLGVATNGYINFGTGRGATGYGFRDSGSALQFKNSVSGSWNTLPSTAAPSDATYITRTASSGLSAEQALGTLASALLVNTTTTGVLSAYAGGSCTSQFIRTLSGAGAVTCAAVNLAADVTGTLPVTSGGTGLTLYAIGDIVYAATTTTLGRLAAVATGNVLISGGTNMAPSWGKVGLATHVSGFLPSANGGTGQSTTATSGRFLKGDGTNWGTSSGAASGTGTCGQGTQWVSATNSDAAPTCLQPTMTSLGDVTAGTWTPVIGGSGGTMGQTYSVQDGQYVRNGRLVYASFTATLTSKGTITANVQIQGLPTTSLTNANNVVGWAIVRWSTLATSWVYLTARVDSNSTTATLFGTTASSTTATTTLSTADIDNATSLSGLVVYETP